MRFWQVQPGDTLSDIAAKSGMDWKKLAQRNKMVDPNRLRPGDVIMLPDDAKVEPAIRTDEIGPDEQVAPIPPAQQPQGLKQFEQPAPYKTSWPDDLNPGESTHEVQRVTSVPKGPAQKDPFAGEIRARQGSPYPVRPNPNYDTPGHINEGNAIPTPEALLTPDFWMDFLQKNLPTAMMGMGPGRAIFTPSNWRPPARQPSDPNLQNWVSRERAQFERNPGMEMDPIYREVRDRALRMEPGRGPGGGTVSPERQAADQKDWNFWRRQGKDSKAVPFPRKNEPVAETYAADPNRPASTGDVIGNFVGMLIRDFIGGGPRVRPMDEPSQAAFNQVELGAQTRPASLEARRLQGEAADTRPGTDTTTLQGRWSDHAKSAPGADYEKNVSPFASAIRGGMERAEANPLAGTQVAGPGMVPSPDQTQSVRQRFRGTLDALPGQFHPQEGDLYYAPRGEGTGPRYYDGKLRDPVENVADIIPFQRKQGVKGLEGEGAPRAGGGPRANVYNYQRNVKVPEETRYEIARLEQQGKIKRPAFEKLEPKFIDKEMPYFLNDPTKYVSDLQGAIKAQQGHDSFFLNDAKLLLDYFAKLRTTMSGAK